MNTSFLGAMIWFTGVVEDIDDPLQLGRTKVRCYGYHTKNKNELPTEDLPWASPVVPITSASMAGVGVSATGLQNGSWVIGFFKDGQAAQDPVILCSIPSQSNKRLVDEGFIDPNNVNPRYEGNDMPKLATNAFEESQFFIKKQENRQEEVPIAVSPGLKVLETEETDRATWNNYDPKEEVRPLYPYNHVTEYESGHVFEVDDRPGYRRISQMHASGTYEEIINDGSRTITVKGDEYEVTFKNKNMYVKGNINLTVDGNMNTLVKQNYHLEVEGNKTELIRGSSHSKIVGNEIKEILSAKDTNIKNSNNLWVGASSTEVVSGTYNQRILNDAKITFVNKRNLTILGAEQRISQLTGFNIISEQNKPLTFKVGTNGLKIDSDGDIQILANDSTIVEEATAIYMN